MRLIHWIFAICLFTASFDILLVFDIGGVLRLSQIGMVIILICALAKMAQSGTILWPEGGTALLLWCAIQAILLPISPANNVGVSYYLLLFFTIAGVYAVLQLYGQSAYVHSLMKIYLASYVFVAFFGLFQLISPSLHLGTFLVQQWILHGKIPRINGFCYEPSYYATYLMMGWIMLVDLRRSKADITAARRWKWITLAVGASLFLSTSRTAWVIMFIEGVARSAPWALRKAKGQVIKWSNGDLKVRLPRVGILVIIAIAIGSIALGVQVLFKIVDPNIFLSGTGLNGAASHSVSDRSGRTMDTLTIFLNHPLMGQTLTGVAARVAELHGSTVRNVDDVRLWWGFPVFGEVLAASGIIGVLPFLWFFGANTFGYFKQIRLCWPQERAKWLRALIRALIFECIILLGNQNLLRVYLWFHVTIVVVVGFNLRFVQRPKACISTQPGLLPSGG